MTLDYEFILRQCRLHQHGRAQVLALLLLDLPATAVQEALSVSVPFARFIIGRLMELDDADLLGSGYPQRGVQGADEFNPDEAARHMKKTIWLQLARHILVADDNPDVSTAIDLIKESDGVLIINVSSEFELGVGVGFEFG